MSANSPNRSTSRTALAALLTAKLVTLLAVADVVYASRYKLEGKTVVMVADAGSDRQDATLDADTNDNFFDYDVFIFVPFGEDDVDWTETNAEDRRALLEKYIHDVVSDNRETANWSYIEYNGKSNPMTMVSGGITYKYEEIPIRVTVYNR